MTTKPTKGKGIKQQTISESNWEKELEQIMDKNTTNLTKTGDKDFNPPEIISFDKVVFEKYQATLELKDFIRQEKQKSFEEGRDKLVDASKKQSSKPIVPDHFHEWEYNSVFLANKRKCSTCGRCEERIANYDPTGNTPTLVTDWIKVNLFV